jgi:hypothetical protein
MLEGVPYICLRHVGTLACKVCKVTRGVAVAVVYDCRDKCFNQFLSSQLGLLWRNEFVLYGGYDKCFNQFLSSQLGLLRT